MVSEATWRTVSPSSYIHLVSQSVIQSVIYFLIQVHSNGSRGDMADSFAFATLFPNVIQPPVSVLCNLIFALTVKVGCCCCCLAAATVVDVA